MPSETGAVATAPAPALLPDHYLPAAGSFDEMCTPDGEVRQHWAYLLGAMKALGPTGTDERRREARRLIRDNGVTYNPSQEPHGVARPWNLDLIPLLMRSDEWAEIERGLIQRAELLNQILLDLYGPRALIGKGLLPPELIDGCAGYLLPCHGIAVAKDRPLVYYAADLIRSPDGTWCVAADHAKSPSGAGYALENRVVLSHVLPSLFRDSHVHRVAGFFRSMRRTLTRLAPRRDEHARVVVLTPGQTNEAHFEHAYLANYLGYTLVQGADLSVRDGALWLRTLGRLEPIHAVLRQVEDYSCDPLELREDSHQGVPGLVQATRTGRVVLANALGSGLLEHPGLAAFLPDLCRNLLGEDLLLSGIPTYWCGDPDRMSYVLDNLPQMVLKRFGASTAIEQLECGEMTAKQLAETADRIRVDPCRFVASDRITPSTSPSLIGGRIEPRPTVLRSFLVSEEEGYAVLPGGLSRIAPSGDTPVLNQLLGGLAKDTWVLASESERQESLIVSADRSGPAVVQESEVSSRVADNLFWIGRYAERAEGLVRLLRVIIFKLFERSSYAPDGGTATWVHPLLEALTQQTQTFPGFTGEGAPELLRDPVPEMLSLISDISRVGALPQTLQALVNAAWSVRDRLSGDTWRVINDIESYLHALTKDPAKQLSEALDELDPLITSLVAFAALTHENMTHNEGWHFLEVGRRLERGSNLATLLMTTSAPVGTESEETLLVEAILVVTDSLITYRRRYQAGTRVGALLDLVFQDEENPRSLAYQLVTIEPVVQSMPHTELSTGRTPAEKLVLKCLTDVRLAEINALLVLDDEGNRREALQQMLERVGKGFAAISDALTAQYFAHEERPHSLLGHVEWLPS
ncbi:MAG: circularly permuted type 2 ATP-grasp protein [Chromatiaceae bacterium]|nr:circularly permuted type 2 ATP-grasp protein [Chromatiaceae bacterium]